VQNETPAPEEKPAEQPSKTPVIAESTAVSEITVWPVLPVDTGKVLQQKPEEQHRALAAPAALAHRESKLSLKAQADVPVPRKKAPVVMAPAAVVAEKKAPVAGTISDSLREIAMTAAVPAPQTAPWSKPSVFPKFDVDVYNLETTLSADGSTAEIKVSTDETIGHYAEWLGIPTHRIRQINRMGGRSDIRFNSPILIPADQPALGTMMQTRLEYHMAIEEDFYGRYKVTDVKQKILRRGEALWDLCNGADQIPLWLLKKYNKQLDLGRLMPGAAIWIPVVEEKSDQEIREESIVRGGIYPVYQAPYETPRARSIYRMP
jgi:membrane-bound lytic murein transglycosylase D